jgi:arylsulfatase A-like enzyme
MKNLRVTKFSSMLIIMAFVFTGCNKKEEKLPHIILVMADDQGWGEMGYNGHPVVQTPNFDDLAASAMRFDHFYASAPVCSPTRGSVLTGRHPNRFGCFTWGNTLRPQEITIAEALKTAGYVTGHFGKWHLGSVQKGSPVNPGASGFDEWFSSPNYFDNDPILSRQGIAVQTRGESSMVTVDAALEFIRKYSGSDQPLFAVVWFGSPHGPHQAIEEDRALYSDQEPEFQNFYGEITGMDRAIGKLRQEIKDLEIDKNTVLWYCSDNGGLPNVGSTGGRGHKAHIYEGGLRVPAIIEWPEKIPQPKIADIAANTFDIYPTVLEIAGVKMENQPVLDGISLLPAIENNMNNRSKPMGFWQYPGSGRGISSLNWMAELLEVQKNGKMISDSSRLVMDAGEITIQYPEDSFPGHAAWLEWPYKLHRIQSAPENVKIELYNLARDSMEQNDLSETMAAKVDSMIGRLEEWQKSVIQSLNGRDYH